VTEPLPRRTVLALLAGSGLGLVVGCSDGSGATERACQLVSDAVPEVPEGLLAIGTRYRELHPDDEWQRIGDELGDRPDEGSLEALSSRVRADFAAGDVVTVDGWVLARTEARAAAALSAC
jgi:hypothetical protein